MDKIKNNISNNIMNEINNTKSNILYYDQLPKYDLFLSQVVDFLNEAFPSAQYTANIIQNYIKAEVISAPLDGKKRGYTRQHLIQLILVSYMRQLLTAEEIKGVFALAFNNINIVDDDIITWDTAYNFFTDIQSASLSSPFSSHIIDVERLSDTLETVNLKAEEDERIKTFLVVMTLIAQAAATKNLVQKVLSQHLFQTNLQ